MRENRAALWAGTPFAWKAEFMPESILRLACGKLSSEKNAEGLDHADIIMAWVGESMEKWDELAVGVSYQFGGTLPESFFTQRGQDSKLCGMVRGISDNLVTYRRIFGNPSLSNGQKVVSLRNGVRLTFSPKWSGWYRDAAKVWLAGMKDIPQHGQEWGVRVTSLDSVIEGTEGASMTQGRETTAGEAIPAPCGTPEEYAEEQDTLLRIREKCNPKQWTFLLALMEDGGLTPEGLPNYRKVWDATFPQKSGSKQIKQWRTHMMRVLEDLGITPANIVRYKIWAGEQVSHMEGAAAQSR